VSVLTSPVDVEQALIEDIAGFAGDPLGFVLYAFPWGTGELEKYSGPDEWQVGVLNDIKNGMSVNKALQMATASGHGIGKSAIVSWIILWAMSTMEDTKGIVTANTETQLKTKTWAELAKWHRLSINEHWFELTATALFSKQVGHDKTWRVDQIAWSETRNEAFAGLHNKGKRVLLVFDEASAIPDIIWEVAEGAMTDEDTEIAWFAFGNPTRARGRFADCFGRFKHRWITRQIDSRTVAITNKAQLQAWVDDYGIDSDFAKVRVLGQFPSGDVNALLTRAEVDAAMNRHYNPGEYEFAAKVLGVDVARQGMDDSVIAFRHGNVCWPLVVTHIPDSVLVAQVVASKMDEHNPDGVHVDATGGYGAGVIDALRSTMLRSCTEVYFSGKSSDPRYFNKRSEMAFIMARWIKTSGALPKDELLAEELCALTYEFKGDKFKLVDKETIRDEIGRSPDRADALGLTFAFPVAPAAGELPTPGARRIKADSGSYDPFKENW
jgi:hypothetical protein